MSFLGNGRCCLPVEDGKLTSAVIEGTSRLVACFAIAFAELRWIYPWHLHYGSFNVTWGRGLTPYIATAVMMTVVAGGAALTGHHLMRNASLLGRITATAVLSYCFLVLMALLFGPLGADIRPLEIRATLFTEYKFLTFVFLVGALYAPVAACVLILGDGQTASGPHVM